MKNVLKQANSKYSKGITLIALVVTIIVLIILASISINFLLGQNGIITKAKEAKKEQKVAEVKEKLSLEIASAETDAILRDENLEQKQVEDIISKYGTLQEDGDTIVTKDGNYELSLKEIWYGVLSESGSYSDKVEQVDMLEKELEDLQTQYKQLESLNQGNTEELGKLQSQITDLQSQIENLKKEKSTLQENLTGQISDLQEQLKEAQTELSTPKILLFTSNPADIKSALPDIYKQLTTEDFIVGATEARSVARVFRDYGGDMTGSYGEASASTKFTYNSETGILTMSHGSGSSSGDNRATASTSGTLFAVYKGTIGGKNP